LQQLSYLKEVSASHPDDLWQQPSAPKDLAVNFVLDPDTLLKICQPVAGSEQAKCLTPIKKQ